MKGKRFIWSSVLLYAMVILILGVVGQAQCQEKYPTRAIDIIVPFGPGGSGDLSARIFADQLKKKWGVPVNVVNKPGGSSIPGTMEVLNAKPDGYTILLDTINTSSVLILTAKEQNIKVPERTRIAMIATTPFMFFVPASSPYKTMKDMIDDIKKNPGAFTWPSGGGNSTIDIITRQLFKAIGVDINKTKPVPCNSAAMEVTLAGSGAIKMLPLGPTSALPNVKAGIIRPLGSAHQTRLVEFPDTPALIESGIKGVDAEQWIAFSGPAKMPANVVNIWSQTVAELMKDPDVLTKIKNLPAVPYYHNAADFQKFVAKEDDEIAKLYGLEK
jgi:tripartite-type tricarboxylate transporter receptor subunit TctC